jgi:hypothetical protein
MAQTFAAAISAVEGPKFDAAVGYTVQQPSPAPVDDEIAAAFAGLDFGPFLKIARRLSWRYRCHSADAEDAVQDALLDLLVKRPDLFREEPESWMGLLSETARYRLIGIKSGQGQVASIEALAEFAGDAPFGTAQPCIAASHDGDIEAKYVLPPSDGEEWNPSQIIGAFQRFRDYFGRPPKSSECKPSMDYRAPPSSISISQDLLTRSSRRAWFQRQSRGDGELGGRLRLRRSVTHFDGEMATGQVGLTRGVARASCRAVQ